MIKVLIFSLFIGFSAFAGMKADVKTKTYTIYSFDASKVILKSIDSKKKWVIDRKTWKEKPSIGKKVSLSETYVKSLKEYKSKK